MKYYVMASCRFAGGFAQTIRKECEDHSSFGGQAQKFELLVHEVRPIRAQAYFLALLPILLNEPWWDDREHEQLQVNLSFEEGSSSRKGSQGKTRPTELTFQGKEGLQNYICDEHKRMSNLKKPAVIIRDIQKGKLATKIGSPAILLLFALPVWALQGAVVMPIMATVSVLCAALLTTLILAQFFLNKAVVSRKDYIIAKGGLSIVSKPVAKKTPDPALDESKRDECSTTSLDG